MSRTNEPLIIKYSSRIKIYLGDNAKIWSKTFHVKNIQDATKLFVL